MNPVAAETAVRHAHRISKQDLLAGLVALAEADSQLKSSNPDPRALMEFLIVQLASPRAAPRFSGLTKSRHFQGLPIPALSRNPRSD